MPAGVTWGQYTKFFVAAMLTMLAGSQTVHMYYKPLDDLDVYVKKELAEHGKVDNASISKNVLPEKLAKPES